MKNTKIILSAVVLGLACTGTTLAADADYTNNGEVSVSPNSDVTLKVKNSFENIQQNIVDGKEYISSTLSGHKGYGVQIGTYGDDDNAVLLQLQPNDYYLDLTLTVSGDPTQSAGCTFISSGTRHISVSNGQGYAIICP